MLPEREKGYLLDISNSLNSVIEYTEKMTKKEFLGDQKTQDAVIRRIEIIGEAARRVSEEIKAGNPGVAWKKLVGMRNVMIPQYDGIDLEIVFKTIKSDFPSLKAQIDDLISR